MKMIEGKCKTFECRDCAHYREINWFGRPIEYCRNLFFFKARHLTHRRVFIRWKEYRKGHGSDCAEFEESD